jgi:GST-like protein
VIDVYFINSPNGRKISIMLAEIGLPHRLLESQSAGFDPISREFRKISPNSRLPAIVDHAPVGGGEPLALFESGAILIYLAEKSGKLLARDPRTRYVTLQWLMWQMAGIGPMHGQAHHFTRYAPDPVDPYALNRFRREAERLLYVMNRRLAESPYLAGDEYSIADIACWPWIEVLNVIEMDRTAFPNLDRWFEAIAARPGVKAGCPPLPPLMRGPGKIKLPREIWSRAFGDELHRLNRLD